MTSSQWKSWLICSGGKASGMYSLRDPVGGARREDPDHGVGLAVQADLTADDVAVGAEPLLPEPVGQDDDLVLPTSPSSGRKSRPRRKRWPIIERNPGS